MGCGHGREIHRLAGHKFGIVAARFTPDSRALLASSGDAAIFADSLPGSAASAAGPGLVVAELLLWDVASGQVRQRFEEFEEDAYSVAISPDGTQALAGSIYNQVSVVWDLQTGNKLRTLAGHREGVAAVAWSQDGRRAISGSLDDGLILWDMSSGDAIVVLDAHASDVLVRLARSGWPHGHLERRRRWSHPVGPRRCRGGRMSGRP